MDTIFIRGLKVDAIIGVYEWERTCTQPLTIDLDMKVNIQQAAATDNLADATNYAEVAEAIKDWVAGSRYQLIEALAEALAKKIQATFNVPWLRLVIHKPQAIKAADTLGIAIERGDSTERGDSAEPPNGTLKMESPDK